MLQYILGPRKVADITADLHLLTQQLDEASAVNFEKAEELRKKASEHTEEGLRANRVAGKLKALLS